MEVVFSFAVGETVFMEKPREKCIFGWSSTMENYCGKEAVITRVWEYTKIDGSKHPAYRVDSDCGRWIWSEDCFGQSPEDIDGVDINISELYPWLTT